MVLLSSTVGKHEAQVYAEGNFNVWKSRVQFVFHNKQIHSHTFSVAVIKISLLLVQNDVEKGCKLRKVLKRTANCKNCEFP